MIRKIDGFTGAQGTRSNVVFAIYTSKSTQYQLVVKSKWRRIFSYTYNHFDFCEQTPLNFIRKTVANEQIFGLNKQRLQSQIW